MREAVRRGRSGQAFLETLLAVLFVTFLLLVGFHFSQLLTARILLDHAAARAARSRAVGFNDFMCRKTARVATIPIAGKRLWPDAEFGDFDELSRVPVYLYADDEATARGVLEYERWKDLDLRLDGSLKTIKVRTGLRIDDFLSFGGGSSHMTGAAKIEGHFPFYLNAGGLN